MAIMASQKTAASVSATDRLECLEDWAAARGGRILVVDDSASNRVIATTMLMRCGFTTEQAEGGDEAVVAAASGRFDLILMDLAMPGCDGLDATRAIRRLPPPAGTIPVVAMSASVLASDVRDRCIEAGMNGCLAKPFQKLALLDLLARLLYRQETPRTLDGAAVAALRRDLGETAFGAVVTAFLNESNRLADHIAAAARSGNLPAVASSARTLAEAAGTCGAAGIAGVAFALRRDAERGDCEAIAQGCARLKPLIAATADRLMALTP